MSRYRLPLATGTTTLTALAVLLFTPVKALPLLLIAAGGAPMTVLFLLRDVTDPDREGRTLWPSLLMGATVVPAVVVALQSLFVALGFALVDPLADAGVDLLDTLRTDPSLVRLLTEYWAYVFIVELAVVAPLAEETTKPLASIVRRPRTATDAFLFGAAAGTGFAVIENMLYAGGWFFSFEYWLSISTMRMIGAGLHAFGAAFVAWGVYQLREGNVRRWHRLGLAYTLAFIAHAVWNGTIAVTQVIYAGRSEFGAGLLSNDALAWGVALQAFLAGIGALVTAGLIIAGKRLREGNDPLRPEVLADLGRPRGIAAWAVLSTLLLIPSTVMVLVFPGLVAL